VTNGPGRRAAGREHAAVAAHRLATPRARARRQRATRSAVDEATVISVGHQRAAHARELTRPGGQRR
jgi:hypothetical protein